MKWEVIRADRVARKAFKVGDVVYQGRDHYGCANDDTEDTGIEHVSMSLNESGEPFFTMPFEDLRPLPSANTGEKA